MIDHKAQIQERQGVPTCRPTSPLGDPRKRSGAEMKGLQKATGVLADNRKSRQKVP